jgi:hypothetical protein
MTQVKRPFGRIWGGYLNDRKTDRKTDDPMIQNGAVVSVTRSPRAAGCGT